MKKKDPMRAWRREAARLHASHENSPFSGGTELRDRMAELWLLLRGGPDEVLRDYRELPEVAITRSQVNAETELHAGRVPWSADRERLDIVTSIAGTLRALDAKLTDLPGFRGKPLSSLAWFSKPADVFVIPRGRAKRTDRQEGPGNGFLRRATPNHNMIPRTLPGGYEVEVRVDDTLSLPVPCDRVPMVGAALFPGQKMEWDKEGKDGWIALGADTGQDEAILRQQVTACYADGLLAAVWPELSMPERRREILRSELSQLENTAEPQSGPHMVVAGSWHDAVEDGHANVMRILDGSGDERLTFTKISRFFGGGVREGNIRDKRIPVVWTQDCLISFAICSDFCDLAKPEPPYIELDVDLVLVPSLGNEKALKGHETNRDRRRFITAGETAVVQQNEDGKMPVGWVLPLNKQGLSEEMDAWSVREVDLD
jgi:hypothetical protein